MSNTLLDIFCLATPCAARGRNSMPIREDGRICHSIVSKPQPLISTEIQRSGHILCALAQQHKECVNCRGDRRNRRRVHLQILLITGQNHGINL
ncbi:MAG: hypothetical protein EPN31_13645 [Castellaniella sp.]|uniref:hypothetical protein n=1 Tax=Castellaniella sp. TaxID=1955812 RepID=UPI0012262D22|nr:hypothetical protein [Castellaniella sp.]TAN26715.1 MAG: hypothetical protein EPN31_13645 [Castellaniella sp.]